MIPLSLPLRLWVDLLELAGGAMADGYRALVEDVLLPAAGHLGVGETTSADIEAVLLQIQQDGAEMERRMLCHFALIGALDVARQHGLVANNVAAEAHPV